MNKESILSIVRHLLTFGGGFLTSSELASSDETGAAIGAVITLAGFGWGVVSKLNAKKTS